MNCDTIKEGKPVYCKVIQINKRTIYLTYWQEQHRWWHHIPFLKEITEIQFGVLFPKDTSVFKIGDKVKVTISIEKEKE